MIIKTGDKAPFHADEIMKITYGRYYHMQDHLFLSNSNLSAQTQILAVTQFLNGWVSQEDLMFNFPNLRNVLETLNAF